VENTGHRGWSCAGPMREATKHMLNLRSYLRFRFSSPHSTFGLVAGLVAGRKTIHLTIITSDEALRSLYMDPSDSSISPGCTKANKRFTQSERRRCTPTTPVRTDGWDSCQQVPLQYEVSAMWILTTAFVPCFFSPILFPICTFGYDSPVCYPQRDVSINTSSE